MDFKINSSYENINNLSHYIYINNDIFQNKLKDFFNKEISKMKISFEKFSNNIISLSPKININNEQSSFSMKKSFISKINNLKEDKKILNKSNRHISSNIFNLSFNDRLNREINRQKTFEKPDLSKKHKNSKKNSNNISSFYPIITPKNNSHESSKISNNNHSFYWKTSKKGVSLLSQMNRNILNSSRNLVNPSRFYKSYFNSLMNTNKKKDIDNSINKRRRKGLTMKFNYDEKTKEEKQRKSNKKSRNNFQYLKDI